MAHQAPLFLGAVIRPSLLSPDTAKKSRQAESGRKTFLLRAFEKWKWKRMFSPLPFPVKQSSFVQCCKVSLVLFPPFSTTTTPSSCPKPIQSSHNSQTRTKFSSTLFSLTTSTSKGGEKLRLETHKTKNKKYILCNGTRIQAWKCGTEPTFFSSHPAPKLFHFQNSTKMRSIIRERNFQPPSPCSTHHSKYIFCLFFLENFLLKEVEWVVAFENGNFTLFSKKPKIFSYFLTASLSVALPHTNTGNYWKLKGGWWRESFRMCWWCVFFSWPK